MRLGGIWLNQYTDMLTYACGGRYRGEIIPMTFFKDLIAKNKTQVVILSVPQRRYVNSEIMVRPLPSPMSPPFPLCLSESPLSACQSLQSSFRPPFPLCLSACSKPFVSTLPSLPLRVFEALASALPSLPVRVFDPFASTASFFDRFRSC